MERSESERWWLPLLHCLYLCVCTYVSVLQVFAGEHHTKHRQQCFSHSVNDEIKEDTNRCRVDKTKHSYSFIKEIYCESVSICLCCAPLTVSYTLHMLPHTWPCDMCHPSFSCYSASHCLRCHCGKKWDVSMVNVHLLRIQWESEDLWLHHWPSVFCCHICMPFRISDDASNFECR